MPPFSLLFIYERILDDSLFSNYVLFLSFYNIGILLYAGPRTSYTLQQKVHIKSEFYNSRSTLLFALSFVYLFWNESLLIFISVFLSKWIWRDAIFQSTGDGSKKYIASFDCQCNSIDYYIVFTFC